MNHDFNAPLTVEEFFASYEVPANKQDFKIKECHPEKGDNFLAVGFVNPTEDRGFTFFALSKETAKSVTTADEVRSWLKANKRNIRLLEKVDDLKFGIIYADSSESWADL